MTSVLHKQKQLMQNKILFDHRQPVTDLAQPLHMYQQMLFEL
jgi:hypothetical protein